MKRHDTDWLALVAGVLALTVGAGYLVNRALDLDVEPAGAVAGLLLLAGLLGVAASLASARRGSHVPDATADAAEDTAEDRT